MRTYRIADIIVGMDTCGRTLAQAEPYRVADGEPEMIITSQAEQLHKESPHLSLDDCEYLSTGSCFYNKLVRFHGILLHSSCVVVDEKAYLFSAPPGTGKSTHVQLWLELFGDRAYILNDDKPALRVVDGKIYAYGTPWSGKFDCSVNARVELGGIAFIRRAADNSIRKLGAAEAMYGLLDQTIRKHPAGVQDLFMQTIEELISSAGFYELSCNMDISAAKLSYETMSGKRLPNED